MPKAKRGTLKKLSGVDINNRQKGLLITPELCIGCRGCQSACKEWNKLAGDITKNSGSYENPPDLTADLYNKIRFIEVPSPNGQRWLFVSQRCMHCGEAGCIEICPAPGALFKTKEGVVGFDKGKCIGCRLCIAGCPFNIPRYDESDKISKCHLCSDRIAYGLAPACAKTCPTGAIRFDDRDELITYARKSGFGSLYGETDLRGLGVMYAFSAPPEYYGLQKSPRLPLSIIFWKNVLKPLSLIGLGGMVVAVAVHYITFGPKDPERTHE